MLHENLFQDSGDGGYQRIYAQRELQVHVCMCVCVCVRACVHTCVCTIYMFMPVSF